MSARPEKSAASAASARGSWMGFVFGGHLLTSALVIIDAVAFSTLWLLSYQLRYIFNARMGKPINEIDFYSHALLIVVPLWLLVTASWGLYIHRERLSSLAQIASILGAAKDGLLASFAAAYLLRSYELGRSVVLMSVVFNFLWLYATRTALRHLRQSALAQGVGLRRALVVGTGETAKRVMARLARHPEIGYDLVGAVSTSELNGLADTIEAREDPSEPGDESVVEEPLLGKAPALAEIVVRERIEEVFIADPNLDNDVMLNMIAHCESTGASFKICANMMEVITERVKIDDIDDMPVIEFSQGGLKPLQRLAKRSLDIVASLALLIVFAIPMLIIAAIIRMKSGAPVFFTQERVGLEGRLYTMWKFRTMTPDTPRYEVAPTDPQDSRITPFGRFLRKTSLDELPQLFNVLRGEMSMVGPRPEMPFIVEIYQEWQRRRLSVKPGVTGLWQIIGRKNLPLAQHLEYDFYYIKNQSLILDVLILFRTVPAVIFGRGAY